MLFVHEGSGQLETLFGTARLRPGDYLVIPIGTTYRLVPTRGSAQRMLWLECPSEIEPPKRYRNEYGQLLEHCPYCERDIRAAARWRRATTTTATSSVRVRSRDRYHAYHYRPSPVRRRRLGRLPVPVRFNIDDFEPITGRVHQPPPVHQTFQARNFVVCSFVPRKFDYHPLAIPAPYNHSQRRQRRGALLRGRQLHEARGIEVSSSPSIRAASRTARTRARSRRIGKEATEELAVMIDTFHPLLPDPRGRRPGGRRYPYSWIPPGCPERAATELFGARPPRRSRTEPRRDTWTIRDSPRCRRSPRPSTRIDMNGILRPYRGRRRSSSPRGPDPWGARVTGRRGGPRHVRGALRRHPRLVRLPRRGRFHGADRGVLAMDVSGTSATARYPESWRGCDLWTFRDGKVVVKDSYWKIRQPWTECDRDAGEHLAKTRVMVVAPDAGVRARRRHVDVTVETASSPCAPPSAVKARSGSIDLDREWWYEAVRATIELQSRSTPFGESPVPERAAFHRRSARHATGAGRLHPEPPPATRAASRSASPGRAAEPTTTRRRRRKLGHHDRVILYFLRHGKAGTSSQAMD